MLNDGSRTHAQEIEAKTCSTSQEASDYALLSARTAQANDIHHVERNLLIPTTSPGPAAKPIQEPRTTQKDPGAKPVQEPRTAQKDPGAKPVQEPRTAQKEPCPTTTTTTSAAARAGEAIQEHQLE